MRTVRWGIGGYLQGCLPGGKGQGKNITLPQIRCGGNKLIIRNIYLLSPSEMTTNNAGT